MSMAFSPYRLAMMLKLVTLLVIGCAYAAPAENVAGSKAAAVAPKETSTDLNTDASSYFNYNDRYSDYGSRSYPSAYGASEYGAGVSGYGVGGYGSIDDRYGIGGYDGGYPGSNGGYGYDRGYGVSNGIGAYGGYNSGVYGGYGATNGGYGGYGATNGGYGGYGGNGGNGGLNSYYGYNNPSYQGYGHTGYGYYNKRPGYGNIYSSGITPSLVTGYRGYSRK